MTRDGEGSGELKLLGTLAGWRATVRASLGELFAPAAPRLLSSRAQQAERSAPSATAPIWRALPWRAIITQATAMWLVTRLIFLVFTYFALIFLRPEILGGGLPTTVGSFSPADIGASWQQWDAVWYIKIATHGYFSVESTAFFPLYPALVGLLALLIGPANSLPAALIIANLGALGACVAIAAFAYNEDGNEATAWRTLRLTLAYPLAFFLAAPYTESLFLAFAVATLLSARRGAWRWVAVWAFLAGLTRSTAVVLILPILWEFSRQQGWLLHAPWRGLNRALPARTARVEAPQRRPTLELVPALAAAPLAILLYMGYVGVLYGDPFLEITVERIYWGHTAIAITGSLPIALRDVAAQVPWSYGQAYLLIDLGALAICTVLTVMGARRLPVAYTLYLLGTLYLCVAAPVIYSQSVFRSSGRYLLVAAPLFLLLARWSGRRPWLEALLMGSGCLLQMVFLTSFLTTGAIK